MTPSSVPTRVQYESNLLGSLGAGVFVGPNTINFNTVFDNLDQKLVEVCVSWSVFGYLSSCIVGILISVVC